VPDPFFMQWHITDRCILNCIHCYRNEQKNDLPFVELLTILHKFANFLDETHTIGRINFSGGEPLLRMNDLINLMYEAKKLHIESRLLTNGLLIDESVAGQLHNAGCTTIQVSIDGCKETHEHIRGKNTFDRAIQGVQYAKSAGMDVTISTTVLKWNFSELDIVATFARQMQARLFVSRFVPCGNGSSIGDQMLTAKDWLKVMRKCLNWQHNGDRILLRDPLYAPLSANRHVLKNESIGGCSIAYQGIAVDSNGDVYPCRRLPLVVGNLLQEEYSAIWHKPIMNALRNRDGLKGFCGKCVFRWFCGGCRAVAYAASGDIFAEDPQCLWNRRISLVKLKRFPHSGMNHEINPASRCFCNHFKYIAGLENTRM